MSDMKPDERQLSWETTNSAIPEYASSGGVSDRFHVYSSVAYI